MLNRSTIETLLLVHGHINFIKFVESSKFDNVYNKIWNIFVWSNVLKVGLVRIHQVSLSNISRSYQISLIKNIQSKF